MKKILLLLVFTCVAIGAKAQTSKELLGKWQLVKWTHNGKEKDINEHFKTNQVYQVFKEDGKFESSIGDETHKSKWKLSKDNKELTITSALLPVTFSINYFDAEKRIVTYPQLGTFEYKKIEN